MTQLEINNLKAQIIFLRQIKFSNELILDRIIARAGKISAEFNRVPFDEGMKMITIPVKEYEALRELVECNLKLLISDDAQEEIIKAETMLKVLQEATQ